MTIFTSTWKVGVAPLELPAVNTNSLADGALKSWPNFGSFSSNEYFRRSPFKLKAPQNLWLVRGFWDQCLADNWAVGMLDLSLFSTWVVQSATTALSFERGLATCLLTLSVGPDGSNLRLGGLSAWLGGRALYYWVELNWGVWAKSLCPFLVDCFFREIRTQGP